MKSQFLQYQIFELTQYNSQYPTFKYAVLGLGGSAIAYCFDEKSAEEIAYALNLKDHATPRIMLRRIYLRNEKP